MAAVDFSEIQPALAPPGGWLQRHPGMVKDVQRAHQLLLKHGAVTDGRIYPKHHLARWRA